MTYTTNTEIAIIGAGIVGIATAYYLSTAQNICNIVLIDPLPPMSFTSAQSGENYRNWWPQKTMTDFTNHSIDLMETISAKTNNVLAMNRRGYALATRYENIDQMIEQLYSGYGEGAEHQIRIHDRQNSAGYQASGTEQWANAPNGVDVIRNRALIQKTFPYFAKDIANLIHIRRGGDISGQQLGQYMLEQIRERGARLVQGKVRGIAKTNGYALDIVKEGEAQHIQAQHIVNAAGPFAKDIAAMLEVELPITNTLQQKIAFHDRDKAIPRDMPFSIDLDGAELDWSEEDQAILAEDETMNWLARHIKGAIHCRPDGGAQGSWIKMGWAYNETPVEACWEPQLDPQFPEIVLRGAAALNPSLKTYYSGFPRNFIHYGGYYPMTEENWPLIGPMGADGAFVVAAFSGFGTMAACAAGDLCAKWIAKQPLPDYAHNLSCVRYDDPALMARLRSANKGVL